MVKRVIIFILVLSACSPPKLSIQPTLLESRLRTDGFYYESFIDSKGEIMDHSKAYFFYDDGTVFHTWIKPIAKFPLDSILAKLTIELAQDRSIYYNNKGQLINWAAIHFASDTSFILQEWQAGSGMPLLIQGGLVKDQEITLTWLEGGYDNKKRTFFERKLIFYEFDKRPPSVNISKFIKKRK